MDNVKKKKLIDKIVQIIFQIIGILCAQTIIIVIVFILIKGLKPFFTNYEGFHLNFFKFLFGTNFIKKEYGVLGLIINTIFIVSMVALIALPISVLTALFIVRIAPKRIGEIMQGIVEMLSSIPSIIYGLFGMGFINPLIRNLASSMGLQTAGGVSTLSVIIILTMMVLPTITILSITSMKAVNEDLVYASLALGATFQQTNFKIVIGGAKSGILAALILGIGRAIGEATAVSMVCGGANGISIGLFEPTGTLTSSMMQGIYESSGLDYDIRFSVGIVLIVIIFISNLLLNKAKKWICSHEK